MKSRGVRVNDLELEGLGFNYITLDKNAPPCTAREGEKGKVTAKAM